MKAESFGYKNAWIAFRGVPPAAVAEALSLRDLREADWQTGLKAAYEFPFTCAVFVTPPIDGWTLCVGFPFFAPVDARPPSFARLAAEWAARLETEVQYFATHRVVEAHAWARALPSGLERAYVFVGESGEKVLDFGLQTAEERSLGFSFFDPGSAEAADEGYWDREDLMWVREDHVMALAGRWSVDPGMLGDRELEVGSGLLGDFGEPLAAVPVPQATRPKPWWKLWSRG